MSILPLDNLPRHEPPRIDLTQIVLAVLSVARGGIVALGVYAVAMLIIPAAAE